MFNIKSFEEINENYTYFTVLDPVLGFEAEFERKNETGEIISCTIKLETMSHYLTIIGNDMQWCYQTKYYRIRNRMRSVSIGSSRMFITFCGTSSAQIYDKYLPMECII